MIESKTYEELREAQEKGDRYICTSCYETHSEVLKLFSKKTSQILICPSCESPLVIRIRKYIRYRRAVDRKIRHRKSMLASIE